jgi:LmbE family N-acetylglucosaminyl deacetylase
MNNKVMAIAAHPDDIEFGMSGTLFLLKKAGCDIHYMNIANGSCGTAEYDEETIVKIRTEEAKNAAKCLGASFHAPLTPDLEIYYNREILVKLASVYRTVAPDILLVPSPDDYMEDHMNACRLAVSAAFIRGMQNYKVDPPVSPVSNNVVIYHAQPHGNRSYLNKIVYPDIYIDISSVMEDKNRMLAEHKSQKNWLDISQGFNAYLNTMRNLAGEVGTMTGKFKYAEGWRRHNPLGLCSPDDDPLAEILSDYYSSS